MLKTRECPRHEQRCKLQTLAPDRCGWFSPRCALCIVTPTELTLVRLPHQQRLDTRKPKTWRNPKAQVKSCFVAPSCRQICCEHQQEVVAKQQLCMVAVCDDQFDFLVEKHNGSHMRQTKHMQAVTWNSNWRSQTHMLTILGPAQPNMQNCGHQHHLVTWQQKMILS